ncbi:hypothetical protein SAMN02745823_00306 [Sporobacter termitidis DSM 10068]|uniref:Uncharacterized protein n=1 Tax=Sporobacter termitidis DSM 10068 TaxID=1123282 RepID=A0A1M5U0S0_9FIRM|nr:hypothetical protein [Sporobacter termitidis]SHH56481.1 hypothetical protein SAMN02745823_00306 [Sporobacter termitidis DSM 10068]
MEKLPPVEKIYEAYSAIADGRVAMRTGEAAVRSSNGQKEYTVTWDDKAYTSNDSATYWQGYAGYPVIAVLLLQGRLPLDRGAAAKFKGIDWTALNTRFKRDYAKAAAAVFDAMDCDAGTKDRIRAEAERVYKAIKELDIVIKRGALRPPKASRQK